MNKFRIIAYFGIAIFLMGTYFWVLSDFGFDNFEKFIDAFTTNFSAALKGIAFYFVFRYDGFKLNNSFSRIIIFIGICFASFYVKDWVFYNFILDDKYIDFIKQTKKVRMFYDAIVFFSFSYFLNQMNEKSNMQSEKQYSEENENLLKEAELLSLRQQLQPHFLFNSLNSISALLMINPQKAQNMLHELSDFLRDTLRKEGNQLLSLETEIGHLQKYLNIETIRFEQRLKVEIAIDNETKGLLLPALILQPIVENAIKFGLYGTSKEVLIKINAKMQNNILLIEVFNPFDTDTRTHQKGEGFGLKSVSRRLNLIYSRNDLLKTKTGSDIFITQVFIPQHKAIT